MNEKSNKDFNKIYFIYQQTNNEKQQFDKIMLTEF